MFDKSRKTVVFQETLLNEVVPLLWFVDLLGRRAIKQF
jgi:hypothetical protein